MPSKYHKIKSRKNIAEKKQKKTSTKREQRWPRSRVEIDFSLKTKKKLVTTMLLEKLHSYCKTDQVK